MFHVDLFLGSPKFFRKHFKNFWALQGTDFELDVLLINVKRKKSHDTQEQKIFEVLKKLKTRKVKMFNLALQNIKLWNKIDFVEKSPMTL